MVRDFNEADRAKKRRRITLPDNPGNLPPDALARLEAAVRQAASGGYLPCPRAWRVARDLGVPKLDVGAMADRLGIRITDCQLGCFKVDKTPYDPRDTGGPPEEVVGRVRELHERGELTCANVFELARELDVRPRTVADAANAAGYKLRQCQLGCF